MTRSRITRRQFLRTTLTAAATAVVLGQLPLADSATLEHAVAAVAAPSRRHAATPTLGWRWVWCQPIRGDWMYPQYTQSDIIDGYLSQFDRIDVLHRAIDQGFKNHPYADQPGTGLSVPQFFTKESLANTVKPWVAALSDAFPGVKVIGRISCAMMGYQSGQGLDPSDPDLATPFQAFPPAPSPYDMASLACTTWMADWGVRYHDNLGIDGIWYDNTKLLLNQTKRNWNRVYSMIHSKTGDSFWVCTNTSSSLIGLKDAVENNVGTQAVCALTESVDWSAIETQALTVGDLPQPMTPLTLHLDFPGTMGKFARVQPFGGELSIPCLDFSQRQVYTHFFESDMQAKEYVFEWPMLAGDPGYGYNSMEDVDPADSTNSLFKQIVSAVNALP